MLPQIINFLPIIATVLSIGVTLGGLVIAWHGGYSKEAGQIQERVITALKQEIEALNLKMEEMEKEATRKMEEMEKEATRQSSVLSTIRYALKQRGLKITIEGDFVTLSESGKSSKITRIQDRSSVLDDDDAS